MDPDPDPGSTKHLRIRNTGFTCVNRQRELGARGQFHDLQGQQGANSGTVYKS
jgi:hypothetical protein